MTCTTENRSDFRERGRLLARHARQLATLTDAAVERRAAVFAVTFRPGDRTASFYDNTLRPAGAAVGVVLSYDEQGREITLGGFRAVVASNGYVQYGGDDRPTFQYDVRPRPTRRDGRTRLYVDRNPSLVELALRMDHVAALRNPAKLNTVPVLPRIVLGFVPDQLPEFTPSEALHRLAAERAGISERQLNSNPPLLVERLLRQTWEALVADQGAVDPQLGLRLVDAELCPVNCQPLRIFEDFRQLVGDWTWNPARGLSVVTLPNDAAARLAALGVGDRGLDEVPQAAVDALLQEWRRDLGDQAALLSEEDFYDALLAPSEPLTAASAAIPAMRKRLTTYWNETATDFDLRRALKTPTDALFASGACRVQVLRRRATAQPLTFSAEDLGRRIDVDWRPVVWPSKALPEPIALAA